MELSDALKRFRKTYNLTQKAAAEIAGVTERNYQRYEYGKIDVPVSKLISLADYFNVSIDYLVGRSDTTKIN